MDRFTVFNLLWKNTEKGDNKRLTKQKYPDDLIEACDIPYIDDGDSYHLLDVYYPEVSAKPFLPVVIDIHGGGWMYGDKELNKNYNLHIAQRGYVVFSISYRLVPRVNVTQQIQDVFAALKKIDVLMDSYPCDRSRVMLTGDSAGGQLAGFASVINESDELQQIFSVEPNSIQFNCVGLVSPVAYMDVPFPIGVYTRSCLGKNYKSQPWGSYMNFGDLLKYAKLPAYFLVTSSGDFLAKTQTRRAYEDLKKVGADAKYMYWDKTDGKHLEHVFSVLYPESEPACKTIDAMLDFFNNKCEKKVDVNV